eukprot:15254505-Alexandrium_andersonii.AAC.1
MRPAKTHKGGLCSSTNETLNGSRSKAPGGVETASQGPWGSANGQWVGNRLIRASLGGTRWWHFPGPAGRDLALSNRNILNPWTTRASKRNLKPSGPDFKTPDRRRLRARTRLELLHCRLRLRAIALRVLQLLLREDPIARVLRLLGSRSASC